jgi:hypothetical protein
MNWVLFIVIASTSASDKVIHSTTIPMATEKLCNAAKAKVTDLYQKTQSQNFLVASECLQTHQSAR